MRANETKSVRDYRVVVGTIYWVSIRDLSDDTVSQKISSCTIILSVSLGGNFTLYDNQREAGTDILKGKDLKILRNTLR